MVICALLISMDIVCARFLSVTPGGLSRISLQFLPDALMGAVLGPVWAMVGCAAADVLGMMINSQGLAYTPLFTLSAAVRGLLYGLMLRKIRGSGRKKAFFAVLSVALVVDLGLNPVWLSIYYGHLAYPAVLASKALTELVIFPARWAILAAVYHYLMPPLSRSLNLGLVKEESNEG
jgi:ECF transporter S component (folate family)